MEDTSYMTRREGDKYYCTFKRCDKKYIHKRQAEDHYYTHHLNQPQYFCQLCDKTFSFRESLQSHNKLVHNGSTEYSIISPQTANRSPHGNCSTSIRIGEVPSKPPIRPLPGLRGQQEQQQNQQNHHHHPQQQLPSHSQPQQIVSNPVPGRPGTRASTGSLSTTSQASTASSGYGSNEHPSNPRIVARVTASANGSHHITWTSPQQDFGGRNTRRSQGQAIQAVVPPTVQMDSSEPEYEVDDFDENMDYFEEDDGVDGEVGFEEVDEGEVGQVIDEKEPVRCTCCGGLFLSQLLLNRHQSMQGEKKDSS